MLKKSRRFSRPWLLAILISLTLSFSVSCKPHPAVLVPVGDARVVAKLPSGNFEVTPSFILEFGAYKGQVAILTLELKKCREEKRP